MQGTDARHTTFGRTYITILWQNPLSGWNTIHMAITMIMRQASKRIWITNPYLIPDWTIVVCKHHGGQSLEEETIDGDSTCVNENYRKD
jgi:phosphatidylserine/phosphatidylglycerophosphate/cardiolipin synthase-like enzyme